MKKSISIKVLLHYQRGELSPEEKREVEIFLRDNPHYLKVLSGLTKLKETLDEKDDEAILKFLEEKKIALKKKIFGSGNCKDTTRE